MLVDTIVGLRQPSAGWVRIDGLDVRGVRLDSLRDQVVVVREPAFFEGTLRENLSFGAPAADEEMSVALRDVGLTHLLAAPVGLDLPLFPSGAPLSRGEAVRVALGRALLARPRLLILDGVLDELADDERAQLWPVLAPRPGRTVLLVTRRAAAPPGQRLVVEDGVVTATTQVREAP
jgi:ABC-type multidrug transport system fused ATPase/permease subunit